MDILAAEQTVENTDWFQGTADAVRKSIRHFRRFHSKHYLILAGDHIYRMDYNEMLQFHLQHNAEVTVGVVPVKRDRVQDLGILKIADEGRITEFVEKPRESKIIDQLECSPRMLRYCGIDDHNRKYLASMGIYLFNNNTLEEALQDLKLTDFGSEVIPKLINEIAVYAYPFLGYWEDIGTIKAFYNANIALGRRDPSFDFFSADYPIYTNPRFLPGSKVYGGKLLDSIISEGCVITNATIERSIIGLRSIINEGAVIKDTHIMGADYFQTEEELAEDIRLNRPHIGIGKNSRIYKAIIDKNARIGDGVKIGPHPDNENFTGNYYVVRDGITVVEKDAVLSEGTEI